TLDQRPVTDPRQAASFLAKLHLCGCSFKQMQASNLFVDDTHIGIVDPLALRHLPGSAAQIYRLEDLQTLLSLLHYTPQQCAEFIARYLAHCRQSDRKALEEKLAAVPALDHNAAFTDTAQQQLFP